MWFSSAREWDTAQVQNLDSRMDVQWLNHVALDLDECEGLQEKHQILKDSPIEVSYMPYMPLSSTVQPTAGHILQHCKKRLDSFRASVGENVCVYKVGLTTNPLRRCTWYLQLNYTRMSLLHATQCHGTAEMLEASLIDNHMGRTGFRNQRSGVWRWKLCGWGKRLLCVRCRGTSWQAEAYRLRCPPMPLRITGMLIGLTLAYIYIYT